MSFQASEILAGRSYGHMKACKDTDIKEECHVIMDVKTATVQLPVKEQRVDGHRQKLAEVGKDSSL